MYLYIYLSDQHLWISSVDKGQLVPNKFFVKLKNDFKKNINERIQQS